MKKSKKHSRKNKPQKKQSEVTAKDVFDLVGISPIYLKGITVEDDERNALWLLESLEVVNRQQDNPFLAMGWKLCKVAAEEKCLITVSCRKKTCVLGRDNFGLTCLWFFELEQLFYTSPTGQEDATAVVVRRFESGPTEPRSGEPYKTVGSMLYCRGEWVPHTEEEILRAHTTDHVTGKKIERESAVIFSTIKEMFPALM